MKYLLLLTLAALASCATPEDNARLRAIGDLALTYAESRGAISASDAAAAREAGKIILSDAPVPVPSK